MSHYNILISIMFLCSMLSSCDDHGKQSSQDMIYNLTLEFRILSKDTSNYWMLEHITSSGSSSISTVLITDGGDSWQAPDVQQENSLIDSFLAIKSAINGSKPVLYDKADYELIIKYSESTSTGASLKVEEETIYGTYKSIKEIIEHAGSYTRIHTISTSGLPKSTRFGPLEYDEYGEWGGPYIGDEAELGPNATNLSVK